MHIAVENTLGLFHSLDTTAADVYDLVPPVNLLHGEEQQMPGDAGYLGIQKRPEDQHRKDASWFIARRTLPQKTRYPKKKVGDSDKIKTEEIKASILSIIEHPFRYIRQVFRYSEVRYRVLAKTPTGCSCRQHSVMLMTGEK